MKLESHYIRLRQLLPASAELVPVEITLDEIASLLDCTHRNAVLLLRKMGERRWLEWSPERGRGKKSKLIFLVRTEDIVVGLAQELVEKKDLRGALEQMNVSFVPAKLKDHFHHWLNGHFGHSSELRNDKRIDTLRFPLTSPIGTLDPLHINFAAESHLVNQLFDSLVRYNRHSQTIDPHLAHAWETDTDRTTWTFYLRKGVLFHHGREMTAEDAAFSLLRLKHAPSRLLYRWVYEQMSRIEAVDPITLQIELSSPNELFLQFLSTNRASIVPKDMCEKLQDRFGRSPVGTGPFRLTRHDASMSVLEAFPSYFQGRAHLDEVELWHIPDLGRQEPGSTLESFQIIHNYRLPSEPSSDWNEAQRHGTTCKFITFNPTKQGPAADAAIRAAIYQAFNRTRLLDELELEPSALLASFVADDLPAPPAPLSEDESRRLLRDAGYRGETVRLCTITHYEQDARLVQKIAQQAGIKLELMLLPVEEFKGERRLQADLLLFSLILDNDLELRLVDLYKSMQRHMHPEPKTLVEQQLAAVLTEPVRQRRLERFGQIERILTDRHLLLFLYRKHLKTIYHSSVKGLTLDALDWVQFKNIWFKP
ncbi:ABC transporter substrate-binding protein [Paenibacillus hamazuiensis]|uniref:ABC transporter substrate-binding protein n=1 Tax=Paenibacillus hamazuiensis TaxID=2936508 RepID=UPI00200C2854|nr:ABC transporter substrate-binding protein [Paenibacillus hamazuiensis]